MESAFVDTLHLTTVGVTLLTLPSAWATAFGFIFCYGKQISSMGKSALFPKFLGRTWGEDHVPYAALMTGSVLSAAVLYISWTFPQVSSALFQVRLEDKRGSPLLVLTLS